MNKKRKPAAKATLGGLAVGDDYPVRVMGVINASPESFYKGSIAITADAVKKAAERLDKSGADIIDVGARGGAPYMETGISENEETERMARAVEAVRAVTNKPISANTKYAKVARAAREAGANILNDLSGLAHDALLPAEAKLYDGVILTANADYANVLGEPVTVVMQALRDALQRAQRAGIALDKLVVDPGIGLFRNRDISWDEWDREILRNLTELKEFRVPVMLCLSRKSFIGKVLEYPDPADRLYGSLGLTSLAVVNGANMVLTHDVAETCDVVRVARWFSGADDF